MKTVVLGLAFALGATAALAASPFDGKWAGTFMRPQPAGDQAVTITVATDDSGRVTGAMTLAGATAPAPIEWGYVTKDQIVYKVVATGPAGLAPFIYIGHMTPTGIEFGRRPEDLKVGFLVNGIVKKAP